MSQTTLSFTPPDALRRGPAPDRFPDQLGEWPALDCETNGVGPGSLPVGVALATAEGEWYLPWAHLEGRQHPAANVRGWLAEHLANQDVIFKEAKRDLEWLRRWGLDLEALNVQPHEVRFAAALLEDHRRAFTLDALAQDRLGQGKAILPAGPIHELPADLVAPYARQDARLTRDLWFSYQDDILRQDLGEVLRLEDDIIYCVMAMERVGAPLNLPKLHRWQVEVGQAYQDRIMELHRRTGLQVNPDSGPSMAKLFRHMGMGWHNTAEGAPSFTEEFLLKHVDVPEVVLALEARQLASLKSKYLDKYAREVSLDGCLRYQLHQLRNDDAGTITGRFAASRVNIQQVKKPSKQEPVTKPWIIRELFVPARGRVWCSADASQIEFRLFAHLSGSARLIEAYKNPKTDFHDYVTHEILQDIMIRDLAKNFNFMKLYGGGYAKTKLMTGIEDDEEIERLTRAYDTAFPEAGRLMQSAIRTVRQRGYVRTILGRRQRRAPGDDRDYAFLNRAIQGGAGDLNKLALRDLYRERKTLGSLLRFTVHDEEDMDLDPGAQAKKRVTEFMNEQRFVLKVPITWEVKTGRNWGMR